MMVPCPRFNDSRNDSSSTFFARGVNGIGPSGLSSGRDDLQHPFTRSISRHPKRVQRPAGVAVGIGEQAEQLMLGPDMGMPELPGRLLRSANNLAGGLCEPFEHERQACHGRHVALTAA